MKISDSAELQSDALILHASEFANILRKESIGMSDNDIPEPEHADTDSQKTNETTPNAETSPKTMEAEEKIKIKENDSVSVEPKSAEKAGRESLVAEITESMGTFHINSKDRKI